MGAQHLAEAKTMSSYELGRALFQLNDPEERTRYRRDPQSYADSISGLTQQERAQLADGDLAGIHERGVSIYLIRTLAYVLHLSFVDVGVATGGSSNFATHNATIWRSDATASSLAAPTTSTLSGRGA
jgi:hypothetical protein